MLNLKKLTLVLGCLTSFGCASAGITKARVVESSGTVRVVVVGSGSVQGTGIDCGDGAVACETAVDELWGTPLLAKPAPGWRLTGFRRTVQHDDLSRTPGFEGRVVIRTAVFERQIASR